jgi:pilus assembly protein Flp/PilA
MTNLYVRATAWLREQRGATAVEYALMVALIAVVIIAAVTLLGNEASETFDEIGSGVGGT